MSDGSSAVAAKRTLEQPATQAVPSHAYARGLWAATGAFAIWGLLPLYLKPLRTVEALEIIAHRVVWSCVLILAWLLVRSELHKLRAALANPRLLLRLALTASLVSVNWLVYVWAVAHGHVVDTSLGYFINPLINVLLGVLLLSERLNRAQWTAVALAAAAVLYLTVASGSLPWISLALAFSFGLYGFVRKVIAVDALTGLAVETLLLMPLGAAYLLWRAAAGSGALGHSGVAIDALLLGSGVVTAVPLYLFAYGARLIPYSTLGLIQYLAPSLQLACGLIAFGEPFERHRAVGFVLIWTALAIYAADGLWRARKAAKLLAG
jgi:chloramphenicol-sensitive protein RarD